MSMSTSESECVRVRVVLQERALMSITIEICYPSRLFEVERR